MPFVAADQPVESINHPLDVPEDEEVSYEVLQRASRLGVELLADTLGYTYVIRTAGKRKTTYNCSKRNSKGCEAKVGFQDSVYIREGIPTSLMLQKLRLLYMLSWARSSMRR